MCNLPSCFHPQGNKGRPQEEPKVTVPGKLQSVARLDQCLRPEKSIIQFTDAERDRFQGCWPQLSGFEGLCYFSLHALAP